MPVIHQFCESVRLPGFILKLGDRREDYLMKEVSGLFFQGFLMQLLLYSPPHFPSSILLKNYLFIFIYFWLHWVILAACGLSLVAEIRGYCLVVVCGLLIVMPSAAADHGLQGSRAL